MARVQFAQASAPPLLAGWIGCAGIDGRTTPSKDIDQHPRPVHWRARNWPPRPSFRYTLKVGDVASLVGHGWEPTPPCSEPE